MKVRCEDCKFDIEDKVKKRLSNAYKGGRLFCKFVIEISSYRGAQRERSNMGYLNGKGFCGYYKRKWWKFWVPERVPFQGL